jgi:hypothetical protein
MYCKRFYGSHLHGPHGNKGCQSDPKLICLDTLFENIFGMVFIKNLIFLFKINFFIFLNHFKVLYQKYFLKIILIYFKIKKHFKILPQNLLIQNLFSVFALKWVQDLQFSFFLVLLSNLTTHTHTHTHTTTHH